MPGMYKVVSDGTGAGTHIYYNGEKLNNVKSLVIKAMGSALVTMELTIDKPHVDVEFDESQVRKNKVTRVSV